MRKTAFITRLLVLTSLMCVLGLSVPAQDDKLTLAEILTGLQSKSSGASLPEKNAFITDRVKSVGVTFSMSSEIRKELLNAGASPALMRAIGANGPKVVVTRRGNASDITFENLWVTYNVTENGMKGMRVHAKFEAVGLKDEPLLLTVRFQKEDGDTLKSNDQKYRNKGGQLAVFKTLKPAYDPAVYADYNLFVPYSAIDLPNGVHKLKVDADIIYPDGTLLKHLKLHPFTFRRGAAALSKNTKLNRMWITHGVTVAGKRGMRINADVNVNGMANVKMNMAFKIETMDGKPVKGLTPTYRSKAGNLTGYRALANTKLKAARYRTVSAFLPYSEFAQVRSQGRFKVHADIYYENYKKDLHVGYLNFTLPTARRSGLPPKATLNSLSIAYNQTVGGRRGMVASIDLTVNNLRDQEVTLAVGVEKRGGGIIKGKSVDFRGANNGQLVSSKILYPQYSAARFRTEKVFIPYDEFDLGRGQHQLRLHVDVLYPEGGEIHLTYRDFIFRK